VATRRRRVRVISSHLWTDGTPALAALLSAFPLPRRCAASAAALSPDAIAYTLADRNKSFCAVAGSCGAPLCHRATPHQVARHHGQAKAFPGRSWSRRHREGGRRPAGVNSAS